MYGVCLYLLMPKALGEQHSRGYKFRFFSNENKEPIHVFKGNEKIPSSKWWLEPVLRMAYNNGFKANEIRTIEQILTTYRSTIIIKWNEHFEEK
jgi:Domain of unknown function (DUF4160)